MSSEPEPRPIPDRAALLDRLRGGETWDLAIIGGGATGLGAAVDAAARGYRVVLVESGDFGRGTSARSTKLVHGGVRYLARGEIGLVREALRERGRLLRNAPHLVHGLDFLVPAYSFWSRPYYGLGMKVYDLLAGRQNLDPSRLVGRDEALRLTPTLRPERLRGGVLYRDGQFDDARLALELALTALGLGAAVLNYLPAIGLIREGGRIAGVEARDAETGEVFPLRARVVLNAAGVYADRVRRLDDPSAPPMLRPSQGAHVVLDRSFLPGETAVMVPKTDDGRVLFAIPWLGRVLLGTTDTPVAEVSEEPRPLDEEVSYLLDHAARYLTRAPGPADIRAAFAGLRPLIGSQKPGDASSPATASLSREHALFVSDSGLVTITGGKWTTYRVMGSLAVERAAAVGGLPARPCDTAELRLHGGRSPGPADGPLAPYGDQAGAIERLIADRPELIGDLHPDLPALAAQVVWAARHEQARTVEDVLSRRTRSLFYDARASADAAPRVAELLAGELGRDETWRQEQVRSFRALAAAHLVDGA